MNEVIPRRQPDTGSRMLGKIVSLEKPPVIVSPGSKPSRFIFRLEDCEGVPEIGAVVSFIPGIAKRGKCGRASGVKVELAAAEVMKCRRVEGR